MGATGKETVVTRSVIVGGARTPIGKFGGGFRDLPAVDLGHLDSALRESLPQFLENSLVEAHRDT